MSSPFQLRKSAAGFGSDTLTLAALGGIVWLACLSGLQAGSVFMKNGYIIQGPIVERGEGSIVLGWPNGKLTIHRRFVDSITYDQNEEKRLAEDEAHQNEADHPTEENANILEPLAEVEDLPNDLEAIMKIYVINTKPGAAGGATNPAGGQEDAPSTGPLGSDPTPGTGGLPGGEEGTASVVPRPDDLLGDRVSDDGVAISFRPPRGWSVAKKSGVLEASGTPAADGLRPSISILLVSRGPLTGADYVSVLKEEDARALQDFELLGDGPREVGDEKAHEIVCRGTRAGRTAALRQLVVEKGENLWLISTFAPACGSGAPFQALEESLKTLVLTAR